MYYYLKYITSKASRAMLLSALLCLLPSLAQAQEETTEDVIRLKNGTTHTGRIVRTDLPGFKAILIQNSRVVLIHNEAIQSTSTAKTSKRTTLKEEDGQKTSGYTSMYEWNLAIGRKRLQSWGWDMTPRYEVSGGLGFQTFQGYQFNPLFALGGTLGIDLNAEGVFVPVALGIRGSTNYSRVNPIYSLDIGRTEQLGFFSGIPRAHRLSGMHIAPAVGLKVNTGNRTALTFLVGYTYRNLRADIENEWNRREVVMDQHRINFRTGFMF